MRSMFTKAVEWEYLQHHPMDGVKELKFQQRPPAFLTMLQADALLAELAHRYVLAQEDGTPYGHPDRPIKPALKRADLRHTFASNLVMRGALLNVLQELLGHRDIKTTMVYAHLVPSAKRGTIDALNRRDNAGEAATSPAQVG